MPKVVRSRSSVGYPVPKALYKAALKPDIAHYYATRFDKSATERRVFIGYSYPKYIYLAQGERLLAALKK